MNWGFMPKGDSGSSQHTGSRAPEHIAGEAKSSPKRAADAVATAAKSVPQTRHDVAVVADGVAKHSGRLEATMVLAGQGEVAGPAGTVSVIASLTAAAAEPTRERNVDAALALATMGVSNGMTALREVESANIVTVGSQVANEGIDEVQNQNQ